VEAEGFISIEDFAKVDLRVGKVLEAEPVPGSRKLIKVTVDLGGEKRTILAGLAKWYKPEDFIASM
jgi:methionine--tRNA ligase beta chain